MSTAPEPLQTGAQVETRSPYWLRPGIDVPFWEVALFCPEDEARGMFFIDAESGTGFFLPSESFMKEPPLWRLSVVADLFNHLKRVQEHATVDLFRCVHRSRPGLALADYLAHFDRLFEGQMGVALAENWPELLRLDYEEMSRQAGAAQPAGEATSDAPTV